MNESLETLHRHVRDLEKRIAEQINMTHTVMRYQLVRGRPFFEPETRKRHQSLKRSSWRFLRESSFLMLLTAPIVYSLILPLLLLDLFVTVFQATCFPVYGIKKVKRRDYIVLDRHRLPYLNTIQKLNCVYCGYANGLAAYVREIASRSEQNWCPIKHARKTDHCHSRHCRFCEYGDAQDFQDRYATLAQDYQDIE